MAEEPIDFFYSDGAITLTNGSDVATGQFTSWDPAVLPYDFLNAGGDITVIEEVISATEMRLAMPWQGPTLTGVPYVITRWIKHTDPRIYGVRVSDYLTRLKAPITDATKMAFTAGGTGAVERTVAQKLNETVSIGDFYINGLGDPHSQLQSFLDRIAGKGGYLDAGGIDLAATVTIRSGTELRVRGGGTAVIRAASTLPAGSVLMINETISGALDTYADRDILLEGIVFDGNNNATRSNSLVAFLKVDNLTILRGAVRNSRYQGLAVAGCRQVTIDQGARFYNCGKLEETTEGGPALWFGATGDGSQNYDVTIGDSVRFFDNEWSAIYLNNVISGTIGGQYRNNKESTIFANSTSRKLRFKGLNIDRAIRKHISAQGIELGASNVVIEGCTIDGTDSSAVSLTDCQTVSMEGNNLTNFGRDNVYYPQAHGVTVISTAAEGSQPKNINIKGGRMTASGPNAHAAVYVGGTGAAVKSVTVEGVDVSETTWTSGKAIFWAAGKRGTNCHTRGNIGAADMHPKVGSFQAAATTGNQSVTGIGFKPSRIELTATLTSGSSVYQGTTVIGADGVAVTHTIAYDTAGGEAGQLGNFAWWMLDGAGAEFAKASFVSFDDDGFTVNVTNATLRPNVRYVAYP